MRGKTNTHRRTPRALLIPLLSLLACTVGPIDEEGRGCPCGPGWYCNLSVQICFRGAKPPDDDGGSPDAGPPGTTITLSPREDSYIAPNATVHSSETELSVYTTPANTINQAILMKFAVAGIPTSSTVRSAVLKLTLIDASS